MRTLSGQDIDATVFIHPVGHADYRSESVGDRLNDPDSPFLPCEIDGESQLLRLAAVAYVVLTEPAPEVESLETVGAIRSPVEFWLKSGDRLQGELFYEAKRGEERVSDMLNRTSSRFLVLTDRQNTYFVLREAVDRVRL